MPDRPAQTRQEAWRGVAISPEAARAAELKLAKEAFHSNLTGSSIMSINVISLAALTSYAIYAAYVSRPASRSSASNRSSSPGILFDYLTTVLPLLLSVTLFAPLAPTYNAALLCILGLLYNGKDRAMQDKRQRARVGPTAAASASAPGKVRAAGKWLEESDSEEEPALPASTSIPHGKAEVALPSEIVPTRGVVTPPLGSGGEGQGNVSQGETSGAVRRRRVEGGSSASAEAEDKVNVDHDASRGDVLPTPEMLANGTMLKEQALYPGTPLTRAREAAGRRTARSTLPFLSVYRAHMMIMTMHCILAVDFPIFPRWLGKCEDFGTSLMDVGVGSFVFSLGIISPGSYRPDRSFLESIWISIRKSASVIALGLVRLVMVKGVDYAEHVTEYGVHWNFFFTLGVLPLLGTMVYPLRRRGVSWTVLAVLVTVWHQFFLSFTPLQAFVLSPSRPGLIGANKEGLTSLPGYFAIYLLGLSAGQHILRASAVSKLARSFTPSAKAEEGTERWRKRRTELALELLGYAVGFWCTLVALRLGGVGVSRRLANLPYVVWTAAYNTTFLLGYLFIEIVIIAPPPLSSEWKIPACPALLEAINKNGLVVFLAANLLTGAVNLSINTMYAQWYTAMGILLGYSTVLCGLAWTLRRYRIKL